MRGVLGQDEDSGLKSQLHMTSRWRLGKEAKKIHPKGDQLGTLPNKVCSEERCETLASLCTGKTLRLRPEQAEAHLAGYPI